MNKKISMIIPHYNNPDKLERLLKTIDMNTGDIQVIVVDDRSDAETEKLLQLRRKYSALVEFYRNNNGKKSAGTARNIGIKHAKGEWLLFADSDDFFIENTWEVVRNICRTSKADIIYFTPTSVIEGTNKESDRHRHLVNLILDYEQHKDKGSELRLRTGFTSPVSKLIKCKLVEENHIRFDETPIANDTMFSVKSGLTADSIEVSKEVIYCITKETNSLSFNNSREYVDQRMSVALRKLKYLRNILGSSDLKQLNLTGNDYFRGAVTKGYHIFDILRWMYIFTLNGFIPFELKYLPEISAGIIKR